MMRGAGVHLAPSGAAGILIFHGVSVFTSIVNASDWPSGDQLKLDGFSLTRVTCDVAPSESIQRTKICVPFGSPSAKYAIRLPSGDQRALEPFTRKRFLEPSAFMIHRPESHRSSILFTQRRVYTICEPPGAISGSETCSQSR